MRSSNSPICICCGNRLSEACCPDPNLCDSCCGMPGDPEPVEYGSPGELSKGANEDGCDLKIICPIVTGLSRNALGKVILSRVTRVACELAISIANEDPHHSMVLTTGGCAGKEWDHTWTGGLIGSYIKTRTKARVLRQMADTFDSTGEMSLVVYTVQDLLVRKKRLPEIVLVVKSGRAWQTASLCRQLLNQLKLNHIPVSVRTYEAPVTELGTPGRAGFKTLYLAYLRAVTRFLNLCD